MKIKILSFLIIFLNSFLTCFGMDNKPGYVEIYNDTDQKVIVKLTAFMSGTLEMSPSPINPNYFITGMLKLPLASTYVLEIFNDKSQKIGLFEINIGLMGNTIIDIKKTNGEIKVIPYKPQDGMFKRKPRLSRGNHNLVNNVSAESIKQK